MCPREEAVCDAERDRLAARVAYLERWQAWAREVASTLCGICIPAAALLGERVVGAYLRCADCTRWLAEHPEPKETP
jgi:hypothetical protein